MYCRIIEKSTSEVIINKKNRDLLNGWSNILAGSNDDLIVSHEQKLARVNAKGICLWPQTVTCPGIPNNAYVSGDRLLVTTNSLEYTAWGMLGPALLFDATDGSLIAQLKGERCASYKDGSFILGLEGYDFFDTWLYGSNGKEMNHWRSYGHYIIDPDYSVRVIECDRQIPTKSCIARLLPDGSIERGSRLNWCQISEPVVLENGIIIFFDAGLLCAVDYNLRTCVQ